MTLLRGNKMKSWKKENKLNMRVTYSMDKYKESEDYGESLETIEGEMIYVNMPMANYAKVDVIGREAGS
jgi:hypothetical protein